MNTDATEQVSEEVAAQAPTNDNDATAVMSVGIAAVQAVNATDVSEGVAARATTNNDVANAVMLEEDDAAHGSPY